MVCVPVPVAPFNRAACRGCVPAVVPVSEQEATPSGFGAPRVRSCRQQREHQPVCWSAAALPLTDTCARHGDRRLRSQHTAQAGAVIVTCTVLGAQAYRSHRYRRRRRRRARRWEAGWLGAASEFKRRDMACSKGGVKNVTATLVAAFHRLCKDAAGERTPQRCLTAA